MHRFLALAVVLALSAACGDDGGGGDGGDSDAGGDPDGGGGGHIDGGGDDFACKHLDIVIAVDGSSSMNEEMAAMGSEVFPGFADALLDISDGLEDYRVGVVDACADEPTFNTSGEPGTPEECTQSSADQGSDACNFASGEAWIEATPATDPQDVKREFRCVGQIDRVQGSDD